MSSKERTFDSNGAPNTTEYTSVFADIETDLGGRSISELVERFNDNEQ